jgi:S-adenosyl-L-methionine hydrolase (adenosine-forming)
MASRPVVALLTDFGLRDHYVGAMKGVIATVCPEAAIVDITHEIPPQDVRAAAYELAATWPYFPDGTVFLTVVDPGVGTARPAIAARIASCFYVGPDNGTTDLVLVNRPATEAVLLTNPTYARSVVSATFEGRDRFAPAAAWLAHGTPLAAFGPATTLATRMSWVDSQASGDDLLGEIVHVDRFGNLVTNIDRHRWALAVGVGRICVSDRAGVPLVRTYGEVAEGSLVALFGSTDRLEIVIVGGNAAKTLGVGCGAPVRVLKGA